jgi:periplasmic divalent cation tolerance protein
MSKAVVVLCTVAGEDEAARLAAAVVERRLAACVNIVRGVRSIYAWKSKLEDDEEQMLVLKTRRDRVEALRRELVARHPYEVPEFLVIPVESGHGAYLAWLDAQVRDSAEPG